MDTIACIIDFNETSKTATAYAIWLAKKHNATINIVHLLTSDENALNIEEKLIAFCGIADSNVPFTCTLAGNNSLKKLPEILLESNVNMVVVGTYGKQSESHTLAPSNVVKLVQAIPLSVFVVNEQTSLPVSALHNILFPMAPHRNFNFQIDEAAKWAKSFDAHVDILCLISDGNDIPVDIAKNLEKTESYFKHENIAFSKTLKESKVYSIGYAKDIISYAQEKNVDLITVMSQNSDENMYFGSIEKTNLLQNSSGIPVLCVNR